MLIVIIIENKTMYNSQELCLHFVKLIITRFVSLIFSVQSSVSLSANLSLHLQFLLARYSPTSHDLSHSHSQLLGFQINPLLHIPFSINLLHLHQHLS